MKRLILMRHAKAKHGSPDGTDASRPLNKRGRGAAEAMGTFLAAQGFVPDRVLASDSARTTETATLACAAFNPPPPTEPAGSLYLASPRTMLSMIQQADDGADCIMMVAHNPGTADLALRMVAEGASAEVRLGLHQFPTGAVAVIDLPIDHWANAEEGRLVHYQSPSELP